MDNIFFGIAFALFAVTVVLQDTMTSFGDAGRRNQKIQAALIAGAYLSIMGFLINTQISKHSLAPIFCVLLVFLCLVATYTKCLTLLKLYAEKDEQPECIVLNHCEFVFNQAHGIRVCIRGDVENAEKRRFVIDGAKDVVQLKKLKDAESLRIMYYPCSRRVVSVEEIGEEVSRHRLDRQQNG